jgi:hypothetical protein
MTAIRTAAIAFALSTVALVAAASTFLSQTSVTDRFVTAIVDQSFSALDTLPVPSPELAAALKPARADRAAIAASETRVAPRHVTAERRIDSAMSVLVRTPVIDVAGR